MSKMKKLIFSNIDEIQANKYCIPIQMNNKSFDIFISLKNFFQITIAKNYSIIKNSLEKYIIELNDEFDDNNNIDFFFIIPKLIFLDYKRQSLHTFKRTILCNKLFWLSHFKQYF